MRGIHKVWFGTAAAAWWSMAPTLSLASFDAAVNEYWGAEAFDIILVQDCSVLDN